LEVYDPGEVRNPSEVLDLVYNTDHKDIYKPGKVHDLGEVLDPEEVHDPEKALVVDHPKEPLADIQDLEEEKGRDLANKVEVKKLNQWNLRIFKQEKDGSLGHKNEGSLQNGTEGCIGKRESSLRQGKVPIFNLKQYDSLDFKMEDVIRQEKDENKSSFKNVKRYKKEKEYSFKKDHLENKKGSDLMKQEEVVSLKYKKKKKKKEQGKDSHNQETICSLELDVEKEPDKIKKKLVATFKIERETILKQKMESIVKQETETNFESQEDDNITKDTEDGEKLKTKISYRKENEDSFRKENGNSFKKEDENSFRKENEDFFRKEDEDSFRKEDEDSFGKEKKKSLKRKPQDCCGQEKMGETASDERRMQKKRKKNKRERKTGETNSFILYFPFLSVYINSIFKLLFAPGPSIARQEGTPEIHLIFKSHLACMKAYKQNLALNAVTSI